MKTNASSKVGLSVNHMSVDCVVLGLSGSTLYVLLIKREMEENGEKVFDYKLPGGLIYTDEDLDNAASRVLQELTGVRNQRMMQFKAFGSRDRISPRDSQWLKDTLHQEIRSLVTIGYVAIGRIGRKLNLHNAGNEVCWVPVNEALKMKLAFDHNTIINEALQATRKHADADPAVLYTLLPHKFTALQLRMLYEFIYNKEIDVRNFKKKMVQLAYIEPLNEYEQGVAHRAARYYRFNRVKYKKSRRGTE
ncbi:MAG: NUDIX hydrolase [Muribaculaceae bacterium]|nr:NUDIX hydrolase [Muribaculaceae bacterium]